jgi:hypothetical protein
MGEAAWEDEVTPRVRQLQIVVAALATGPVVFAGIALFAPVQPVQLPLLAWVAAAFALMAFVLRALVPKLIVARTRQKIARGTATLPGNRMGPSTEEFIERTGDAGYLWLTYMTRTIVAAALLEGAAFFNLVVYLLQRSWMSLAVATALVACVLMLMPTPQGVIRWIGDQLEQIERLRRETV